MLTRMLYVFTLLAGIAGAGAGLIAATLARLLVPASLGAAAHQGFGVIDATGATIGLAAAICLAARMLRMEDRRKTTSEFFGRGVAAVAIVMALAGSAIQLRIATLGYLRSKDKAPAVEYGIRLPVSTLTEAEDLALRVPRQTGGSETVHHSRKFLTGIL